MTDMNSKNYFKGTLLIASIFCIFGLVLIIQKKGQSIDQKQQVETYLTEKLPSSKEVFEGLEKKTLVLMNSKDETSARAWVQYQQILKDMRLGYQVVDVSEEEVPDFNGFDRTLVLFDNLEDIRESVFPLVDWTEAGGQTLFGVSLSKTDSLAAIETPLGISQSSENMAMVEKVGFSPDFMIGSQRDYKVSDPFESAFNVELLDDAKVYAWSTSPKKVPLVWSHKYGKGKFVLANLGIYERATRGFYAASISLLGDAMAYPVINGAVYYLDDFPSPIPSGDARFIQRDYHVNIQDFYTNIWWPDVQSLEKKYGVRHTGGLIENYENDTSGKVQRQDDLERFRFFGQSLLNNKGEIAYHGYNHQPFSLENVDYGTVFPDYKKWPTTAAMESALKELMGFAQELYPDTEKSVYIPPSNVLSTEGRAMLGKQIPKIKAIASNYFSGDYSYVQEFSVAEDGMVELPRIASGAVWDDYMTMSVVSELNYHFVSSHFLHPDDTLDVDRGAEMGWKKMFASLDKELAWIHKEAAPQIRQMTGSEITGAVQRYSILTVDQEIKDKEIRYSLGNFKDHAYLFVRINEGEMKDISGGTLTKLGNGLYLMEAQKDHIVIRLK